MVSLKEILEYEKRYVVDVKKEDYSDFLSFAKYEGFVWKGGKEINPKKEKQDKHESRVIVDRSGYINVPRGWAVHLSMNPLTIFDFSSIKEKDRYIDLIVNWNIEESDSENKGLK